MDKGEHKVSSVRQKEAELLEQQRAHVKSFEEFETLGLDLNVLIGIFGTGVLRSDMRESHVVLDLVKKLYAAFSGDNKYAAVLCTVDQMVPGFHGFGGPEEYERKAVLRLYSGVLSPDQITYIPKPSSEIGSPEVVIEAPSTTIYPDGERQATFAPSTLLSVDSKYSQRIPVWLDGSYMNWMESRAQIQIFGAKDPGSLFEKADVYMRATTSSNTRGVQYGVYSALNDWVIEQVQETPEA